MKFSVILGIMVIAVAAIIVRYIKTSWGMPSFPVVLIFFVAYTAGMISEKIDPLGK